MANAGSVVAGTRSVVVGPVVVGAGLPTPCACTRLSTGARLSAGADVSALPAAFALASLADAGAASTVATVAVACSAAAVASARPAPGDADSRFELVGCVVRAAPAGPRGRLAG